MKTSREVQRIYTDAVQHFASFGLSMETLDEIKQNEGCCPCSGGGGGCDIGLDGLYEKIGYDPDETEPLRSKHRSSRR